jgi:2-keto-4-pentenoate hydratase/2-oxohepta-3-ene-1,7-dioic acid hydratase in catechol pathway
MRVGQRGREVPVVSLDGEVFLDARPITDDYHPGFFASGGLDHLREAVKAADLPAIAVTGLRIGAPVARPTAVICIGQNYAAHAAESGAEPPTIPIVFFKHPNTLNGPYDDVRIPRKAENTDWEVELAVVIASEARYLPSREDALACIAGYAVSNDVSEREFQTTLSGGQWSKGKSCEDFQPLGPWLVVDEVADPQTLGLRSWVNGEPRQDSNSSDMIFGVTTLIQHLSQFMVLSPGDVINTGTPQGVALSGRFPYLKTGDFMELEIDGLGRQRQNLTSARS